MQQRINRAFAMVAVTCLTAVAAFAAVKVQFFTAECINDQLVSSFKVTGLGKQRTATFTVAADAVVEVTCINNGGNEPPGQIHTKTGVSATGTFPVRSGQTTGRLVTSEIDPAEFQDDCPPGFVATEVDVLAFENVRLVYTAPTTGKLRLLRNPASTDTLLVLDLVANENLTGYGVGFNLPVDLNRVRLDSLVPGTALPAGSNPVAARAALPLSGPMQGILTAVQSQKASGTGAVATDTAVPAGAVLFTLRLSLASSSPGTIFDGASMGTAFNAAMRDKLGTDVVRRTEFGIGRLEVLSP